MRNVPEYTFNDVSSRLASTRYLHKQSMSEGNIERQDSNSDTKDMVSNNKYGKHCSTKG